MASNFCVSLILNSACGIIVGGLLPPNQTTKKAFSLAVELIVLFCNDFQLRKNCMQSELMALVYLKMAHFLTNLLKGSMGPLLHFRHFLPYH